MRNVPVLYFLTLSCSFFFLSCNAYEKSIRHHRQLYKEAFVNSTQAPLDAAGVKKMQFFDINDIYLVNASFRPTPDEKPFEMATFDGKSHTYIQYGILNFQLDNQPYQLAAYQNFRTRNMPMFRERLFIPFKDLTNGETTYGGGRYLDVSTTDIKEEKLILDFNKSYNPYCAYSDAYSCPIPPEENHLEVAILAGEKKY